jgi:CubicO group peptidase (beta-lactamase class C family)
MRSWTALVFACTVPLGLATAGDDAVPDWAVDVAGMCREAIANGEADGLSVEISTGTGVLFGQGFGYSAASAGEVADVDSKYPVGSLLDQLVTVAVLQQWHAEALDLETPLAELLPNRGIPWPAVRLRHVLENTSGIPDFTDFARAKRRPPTLDEVLAFLVASPLESDPGTCFAYSNGNTLFAAMVAETVSGRTLEDLFATEIFGPAGMDSTRWCDEESPARGETYVGREAGSWVEARAALPGRYSPALLCSTVGDLTSFRRALTDRLLVSDRAYQRLTGEARLRDGTSTGVGYGFDRTDLEGLLCQSFGGGIGGARLHVAYYPESDVTVALAATGGGPSLGPLARRVARALFDLPQLEVLDLRLEPGERDAYVGGFYVGCDRYVVRDTGERLEILPPFGEGILLRYQGHQRFLALNDEGVELTFTVNDEGSAVAFVLVMHGFEIRAIRRE